MKNILIVEDDGDINRILQEILKSNEYNIISAYSGTEAIIYLDKIKFDMILLDLMLPGMDGEKILNYIRSKSSVPVIIISAKNEVKLKSNLLRLGADDYITKPFENEEVLARVITNLRRYNLQRTNDIEELKFKDITINKTSRVITVGSKPLSVTSKEYKILELMVSNKTKIFSKANLFETVWNEEYACDDNTINVHMSNIRNKLKKINEKEDYIETIWGMGYKLT
ncbi:MAG: response regulator transcription factor [Paraclostridium sp.]|uniref:response regulator transcription factor n=1 Tax=Paraclostridium sp. TaxID=2023273 RepID=UPI003F3BE17A